MKQLLKITLLLLLILATFTSAKKYGIGIVIGQPSGISANMWVNKSHLVDATLAWSLGDNGSLSFHADYLFTKSFINVDKSVGYMPFYYGFGGRVRFGNKAVVGARVPFGLDFFFKKLPIDIFLEVVPVINLMPDLDFAVDGGVGIRYRFNR